MNINIRLRYEVRRPFGDNVSRVVTAHHTRKNAIKSLHRQRRGSTQQGGYSQDYLFDTYLQSKISEYDADTES